MRPTFPPGRSLGVACLMFGKSHQQLHPLFPPGGSRGHQLTCCSPTSLEIFSPSQTLYNSQIQATRHHRQPSARGDRDIPAAPASGRVLHLSGPWGSWSRLVRPPPGSPLLLHTTATLPGSLAPFASAPLTGGSPRLVSSCFPALPLPALRHLIPRLRSDAHPVHRPLRHLT